MFVNNNETNQNIEPSTSKTRRPKPRTARQVHKQLKANATEDNKSNIAATSLIDKKITDYFAVRPRGCEGIPKSPKVTRKPKKISNLNALNGRNSVASTPNSLSGSDDNNKVEVISLIDSDDDCDGLDSTNLGSSKRSSRVHNDLMSLKSEWKRRISRTDSSKKEPCGNSKVNSQTDEDVEIVEILPPIPLRDHPTFYVEGEED